MRILAVFSDKVRMLSYNSQYTGQFEHIFSIQKLLKLSPLGFKPYSDFGGFRLNSKSFRTKEYSERKKEGVKRILTIGDSFTFGSGMTPYKEHWPALLESKLQEKFAHQIELINLGVGGVGPRFELRLWQLEGVKLHPDLVILAFCIGNDFTEEQNFDISFNRSMASYSYLFRIIRNLYRFKQTEQSLTNIFTLQEETNTSSNTEVKNGGYEIGGYGYDSNIPTFSQSDFLRIVSTLICYQSLNQEVFTRNYIVCEIHIGILKVMLWPLNYLWKNFYVIITGN